MRPKLGAWLTALKFIWAAPCSIVGLLLAIIPLALGGKAKWVNGAVEVTYRESPARCHPLTNKLLFRGLVCGHVILAVTEEELEGIRSHERVHVAQYERWGIFFLIAYALSGIWQLVRGRDPYWDNYFEIDARLRSSKPLLNPRRSTA